MVVTQITSPSFAQGVHSLCATSRRRWFIQLPQTESQQEQEKENLPIVLTLAEGLANAAGAEALRGPAPLFILRAGMWGEVGDVGDLPSEVLGLADRFSGWATSSCKDH